MNIEWKTVDRLADALADRFGRPPEICIVLGSGLRAAANELSERQTEKADRMPDWPVSTVEGHEGSLHVGVIGDVRVLLLEGRVHLYEGYSPREVVRPIRAAVTWGVNTVILTNASGAVDPNLVPGQLMILEDHINLTGCNPLVGTSDDSRGPRFPNLEDLYDSGLRSKALECSERLGMPLSEGVYACMLGPSYETPAEIRFIAGIGAQAVGMSTVLEAIAARHLGAKVAGISCITNRAAGLKGAVLDHAHVQRIGETAADALIQLLAALVAAIGEES
ncbi:MAG: purine-nucleoside phosphorylase [Proteobacteria bacterium]|nr:purine-nucleoside phosphorylase [Pseudomonadota bacterium]